MQIRAAGANDLATIETLFEELDAFHRVRMPERFRASAGPPRSPEHLLKLLQDPSAILLAEDDADALGFVHLAVRDAPEVPLFVPRRFVVVENLVVAERARRRGVGRELMAEANAWARSRGATALELGVYALNADANAFYRALGYDVLLYRLSRPVE
jgi:ribosomal protein S18 acetylase RimI-like enzyme